MVLHWWNMDVEKMMVAVMVIVMFVKLNSLKVIGNKKYRK